MLKYRINTRQFLSNDNSIPLIATHLQELYTESGNDSSLLLCACEDLGNIQPNTSLVCLIKTSVYNNVNVNARSVDFDFYKNYTVNSINKEENVFTLFVDKYFKLTPVTISTQTIRYNAVTEDEESDGDDVTVTYTSNRYVYFYFENSHYFNNPSFTLVYDENGNIITENDTETIQIYLRYYDESGNLVSDSIDMEYVSTSILRVSMEDFETLSHYDTLSKLLFNGNMDADSVGNKENVEIYRDEFFFNMQVSSFSFYYDNPVSVLKLPLGQHLETNLMQSEAIKQNFIEVKKKNPINKTVDMEKDVYHPVIIATVDNKQTLKPVYRIKFNLHFREHRGDDWLVEPSSYWNGTYIKNENSKNKLALMGSSKQNALGFFSLLKNDIKPSFKDGASSQSDLLSYLNFTNGDVKFQKNKLKKSFLRLSFYDSTNQANQNLLHYSSIFMNSGEYFTKYVRHIEDYPYSWVCYDDDGKYEQTLQELTGVRVGREPSNFGDDTPFDDMEEYRLSSQFTVYDKYNSNSSSEGFYLYLWKDNDNGLIPTDIYMKVEFNHAGYGRSIPFMMPFWDNNKWEKKGIKTFQEIIDDWNEEDKTDGQYGIKQYLKFSYIHFKYRFDYDNKQHIYYLDNDFYGDDSVNFEDNTLVFNLYEAKLSDGSSVSSNDATIDGNKIISYGNLKVTLTYDPNPIESTLQSLENNTGPTSIPKWSYELPYVTQDGKSYVYQYDSQRGGNVPVDIPVQITWSADKDGIINPENGELTYNETNENDFNVDIVKVTLTVKIEGKTASKTVTVQQKGGTADYQFSFEDSDQVEIEDNNQTKTIELDGVGGDQTIKIISTKNGNSIDFSVNDYTESDWFTIDKKDGNIDLSVTENTSENSQEATITLTQDESNKTLTLNIKVGEVKNEFKVEPERPSGSTTPPSQTLPGEEEPNEEDSNCKLIFNYNGGEEKVIVTSTINGEFVDYGFNMDNCPAWISSISKEDDDYGKLIVKCDKNVEDVDQYWNLLLTQEDTGKTATVNIEIKAVQHEDDSGIVIPDVDYLILRYYWGSNDGRDLDTMTYLEGTELTYDNYNIDGLSVGFNGTSPWVSYDTINGVVLDTNYIGDKDKPYLMYGGDNRQSGNESCLIDFTSLCSEENLLFFNEKNIKHIYAQVYSNWYAQKNDGNCQVSITAYKGGVISRQEDNIYNFVNTGGDKLYDGIINANVFAFTQHFGSMAENFQKLYSHTVSLKYNIAQKTLTLTPEDKATGCVFNEQSQITILYTTDDNNGVIEMTDWSDNASFIDPNGNIVSGDPSSIAVNLCGDLIQRKLEVTLNDYPNLTDVMYETVGGTASRIDGTIKVTNFNEGDIELRISFVKESVTYSFIINGIVVI